MSSSAHSPSSIGFPNSGAGQDEGLPPLSADLDPSERHLPSSKTGKDEPTDAQALGGEQIQETVDSRKSQLHERDRSAANKEKTSSTQSVVLPSSAAPLSPPSPPATGASPLASPTTHDVVNSDKHEDVEEPAKTRPRKRGVAQSLTAKAKCKRVDAKADNDFMVPDGNDDPAPSPKRIKAVVTSDSPVTRPAVNEAATDEPLNDKPVTSKRKRTAKPKAERKPSIRTPTSALDRAQKAEEARSRKQKNANKIVEALKKQPELKRSVIMSSAQDQKLKELRQSVSALPPALFSGRGLDSEFVNKKTWPEVQDMHRSKPEATAGASQARMETDPSDKHLKIMYLAKYTKKIPVFPKVYTDLDKIIAAPYAFPQVELDMEAGEFGILRIRWFPTASDPDCQQLAKDALARHKDAISRRPRTQRW